MIKSHVFNIMTNLYEMWYWHYKKIYKLKKTEFNIIVEHILNEYGDRIVNNPHGVKLDYHLGELSAEWVKIKKRKLHGPKPLGLATNRKIIRLISDHTSLLNNLASAFTCLNKDLT